MSYPIAVALAARGLPFVFSTGYDKGRLLVTEHFRCCRSRFTGRNWSTRSRNCCRASSGGPGSNRRELRRLGREHLTASINNIDTQDKGRDFHPGGL
jgi:hypothetical protein